MNIAIVFGSHRTIGRNNEIEVAIKQAAFNHDFDFIRLAKTNITPTLTETEADDSFDDILKRLKFADVLFLIIPVYCPYPSKFVAFMERLLDVSYQNSNKPLKGKPVAIFYYCSNKICDETPLKVLFQKYLMDDYRFDISNYEKYLNAEINPNEKYNHNITEYILDVIKSL